jgi:hypothetical protein
MKNENTIDSGAEINADTDTDTIEEAVPMRILRITEFESLSKRSQLIGHIGCNRDTNAIALRLWANSAAGMFSKDWVSMADVSEALSGATKITSASLQGLFAGISKNQAGFMLALLKSEGIVTTTADRGYECLDPTPFLERTQRLIKSGVDLSEDDDPQEASDELAIAAAATTKRAKSKKHSA